MTVEPTPQEVQKIIREEGDYVTNLLIEKNKAYGNSAVCPKRFFSQAETTEQIKVRIDDKLNRLVNGLSESDEEDVVLDLIGYLILLRVAIRVQAESESRSAISEPKPVVFPTLDIIGPGCFPGKLGE